MVLSVNEKCQAPDICTGLCGCQCESRPSTSRPRPSTCGQAAWESQHATRLYVLGKNDRNMRMAITVSLVAVVFIFGGLPPVGPLQASYTQVLLVGDPPLRSCLRALDVNNEADEGSYSKHLSGVLKKKNK